MKSFAIAVLFAASFGSGSFAQSNDWSGFYGGTAFGTATGDLTAVAGFPLAIDGRQSGGFLGYNFQRGNLIYGAELAYYSGDISRSDMQEGTVDRFADLKGRVGYAFGRAMYYGILGYSTNKVGSAFGTSDGDGFAYGIGVDVRLTDRIFVGAEYLRRNMHNDESPPAFAAFDVELDTVSLRVGMSF